MVVQEHRNENELAEIRVVSETVEFKPPRPPPPYSPMPPNPQADHRAGPKPPTVIQNTIIVQQVPLKTSPVLFNCPVCKTRVETRVNHSNTRKTHLMAGFICGFTFWCLLCCLAAIPYLFPIFKKTEHYCPNCKTYLGSYSMV